MVRIPYKGIESFLTSSAIFFNFFNSIPYKGIESVVIPVVDTPVEISYIDPI